MKPSVTHLNPPEMHNNPAFTQAVVVAGNARTVYVGGQNAVSADGQIVGAGNLVAQTEQVFTNLQTVLAAAGATIHDVIKWNIYVVQGQDFRPAFGVFQRVWGRHPNPPAISVLVVAGLANPQFLVEVEAVAVTASAENDGG